MITTAIIWLISQVLWLFTYPLRLLPDAALPDFLTITILTINEKIAMLNYILPMNLIWTFIGAILVVEVSIFTLKTFNFVLRLLPGK